MELRDRTRAESATAMGRSGGAPFPAAMLFCVLSATVPVPAQGQWMEARHLTQRSAAAMAYDSARERTVLFGGIRHDVQLNETWEWDGNVWLLRDSASSPPPRSRSALAYDAARRRIVLFGGLTA